MKSLFTLMHLILCLSSLGQTFQPLDDNKHYSDQISFPVINDNALYYIRYQSTCDTNMNITHVDHYGVRIDLSNNIRTEKRLNISSPNLIFGGYYAQYHKDTLYLVFAYSYYTSFPLNNTPAYCNLKLIKLDTLFNVIDTLPIQGFNYIQPVNNLHKFLNDSSILLSNIEPPTYTATHTLLNPYTGATSNSITFNHLNTYQKQIKLSDSTFIISYWDKILYFKLPLTVYDSLSIETPPIGDIKGPRFCENMVNENIVYNFIDDSNGTRYNRVALVNPYTKQIKHIYKAPAPTYANMNYAWVDCATSADNYILTTNNYKFANTWLFTNSLYNTTQIEVNRMDTNGNLQWQRIIGGDANYFTNKILATPDSGCLIFVSRYDSSINHFENDTYYIKLDKDGNQQYSYLPTSVPYTPEFLPSIILYPNPSSTTIAVSNLNPQQYYTYTILDSEGATLSKGIYRQPIEVTRLSSGIYYLSIEHKNQRRILRFVKQ